MTDVRWRRNIRDLTSDNFAIARFQTNVASKRSEKERERTIIVPFDDNYSRMISRSRSQREMRDTHRVFRKLEKRGDCNEATKYRKRLNPFVLPTRLINVRARYLFPRQQTVPKTGHRDVDELPSKAPRLCTPSPPSPRLLLPPSSHYPQLHDHFRKVRASATRVHRAFLLSSSLRVG